MNAKLTWIKDRCPYWLAAAVLATGLAAVAAPVRAGDTTAAHQLERFNAQAGTAGQAERGRVFFTSRHGGEWSCASCHGNPPTSAGKHASTGKSIEALDVAQRECTPTEKADVLAYLLSLMR